MTALPALGFCVCGYPSWTAVAGQPMHLCCATNGAECEPCRISRDEHKKHANKRPRKGAA